MRAFFVGLLIIVVFMANVVVAHDDRTGEAVYRYICACAMASGCNLSVEQPGKCPCGKALLKKRVLAEDEKFFYVCAGDEKCDCGLSEGQPGMCSCGRPLHPIAKSGKTICGYPNAKDVHCGNAVTNR